MTKILRSEAGAITANGQAIAFAVDGASLLTLQVVATSLVGHNAAMEGSINSTNGVDGDWFSLAVNRSNSPGFVDVTTGVLAATPLYLWRVPCAGLRYVRVRATAHTSGTATYFGILSTAEMQPQGPSTIIGTSAMQGQAAHDAPVSGAGNPIPLGAEARNAQPTAVANADLTRIITTLLGVQIVKPYAIPEAVWSVSLALTNTTPQALQDALASNKRCITALQAINTGTAVDLIILDGSTERWRMTLPQNVPVLVNFPTELITTANTALNANLSAAGTVRINAQGYSAP